ncbi:MAG TPA: hypothetical protein PK071_03750 [Atopobiaceae bacterium]|nr:hypothetical protein [Atopobiaceae bacterium]
MAKHIAQRGDGRNGAGQQVLPHAELVPGIPAAAPDAAAHAANQHDNQKPAEEAGLIADAVGTLA